MTVQTRGLALVVLALVAVVSVSLWFGRLDSTVETETAQDVEAQVRATCSDCLLFPPPEILPRSGWRIVVNEGPR